MKNKITIVASLILSALFFMLWRMMFSGENDERLWHSFLINFLFFTSLAGGLAVWPAIVVSTYGRWMGTAERFCRVGLAFSFPSVIALVVLWIGSESWAPWLFAKKDMFWLNNTFLFSRNIAMLIVFWILAFVFVAKRHSENKRVYARWLVLAYVISFSLLGFDFVMELEPEWYSMMTGGYFFSSAVYLAAAAWALMAVLADEAKDILHDIGKLVIAFCMFTSYLMFSHLFPIWYENNPHEVLFLIPRMNFDWKWISYLLLLMVYIGPIALLLPARMKRNRITLGGISLMIVAGMWIERWWLISAVFSKERIIFGWEEIVLLLAFLLLFVAGVLVSNIILSRQVEPEKLRP